FDGFAMNITLISYHDNLDFGIIACRRSLPQIQRMIDHLEDSLAELEALAGSSTAQKPSKTTSSNKSPRRTTPKRKHVPAKKTNAKTKAGGSKTARTSSTKKQSKLSSKSKLAAKSKTRPPARPKLNKA
ncbi:MAG: WS/DGAT domain-containing protein, partial [Pseudomonadota bacterium]